MPKISFQNKKICPFCGLKYYLAEMRYNYYSDGKTFFDIICPYCGREIDNIEIED